MTDVKLSLLHGNTWIHLTVYKKNELYRWEMYEHFLSPTPDKGLNNTTAVLQEWICR